MHLPFITRLNKPTWYFVSKNIVSKTNKNIVKQGEKVASKVKRPDQNLLPSDFYFLNENIKNESLHANRSSKII